MLKNIKKQIIRLYLSSIFRNLSLTGAWVAILSSNLLMVCISITFHAMSENFSSGSGDALAYDSLKLAEQEAYYEAYASHQLVIYRFCSGISTLCAGLALLIGHQAAYGIDILIVILQILILLPLYEARICENSRYNRRNAIRSIWKEFADYFIASLSFLKQERDTVVLMFCNSLVGSVDILLLFFLQAKLPEAGMPDWALGIALFFMEMGGILGSKLILKWKKLRYRSVFMITALFILSGILMEHSGIYAVMTLGGFAAALGDDALQVRTNTILQNRFPSEQRATLISMESFTFSMVMIVLSPLAGILFSLW